LKTMTAPLLARAAACLGALLLLPLGAAAATTNALAPINCLECHKQFPEQAYQHSVHQTLSCQACHVVRADGTAASPAASAHSPLKAKCEIPLKPVDCAGCHQTQVKEHAGSVHNSERLPLQCSQCHADIHTLTSIKNDKVASARLCSSCHERQHDYFKSGHSLAIAAGRTDAATCTDCHGLHAIARIDNEAQGRLFHTQACLKCHADAALMERNQVTTLAPETFFESYHGKNVRLGYPERVAGCADCHGAHQILPADAPASKVHAQNLVQTCGQCHTDVTPQFVRFEPHAKPTERGKFPVLFWTMVSMTALLVGTFAFFWVHSLLWAFRSFIEKRQHRVAESFPGAASTTADAVAAPAAPDNPHAKRVFRRFKPIHVVLHLMVIVSFLGLALTGLPLKFSHTAWGKWLMDLLGGPASAGLIHRACAVITFAYFAIALVMSIHFLFFDQKPKGNWWQRLFGPDSLCFNLRDVRDVFGMFRWFFFAGPKPRFDRWTYWEKFDFMAVFWGMLVIGSSGLMLWFPEFFGRFLPGWMFNVATIIHSDEALLATGFIFTIHFFNTHFRPEKFPMDKVIFNGEITGAELQHERADQWERYQQDGQLEQHVIAKPSSTLWEIVYRIFGALAVLTGLLLAAVMFWTFLFS